MVQNDFLFHQVIFNILVPEIATRTTLDQSLPLLYVMLSFCFLFIGERPRK